MKNEHTFRLRSRRTRLAAYLILPLAAALTATACSSPTEDDEPEIGTVRLVIGTQTVNVTGSGAVPIITISGASNLVTATFLDDDGATLTLDPNEFEIRLVPANAGVLTFTRTSAFVGTFNRVAAGNTIVKVSVFHKVENHPDFGEFDLIVTVQ